MKNPVTGRIAPGYGVASGRGGDERYPEGTLRMQAPHFKDLGLSLDPFFPGTINVDISPLSFRIVTPKFFFKQVDWSPHIHPENFYFFDAGLEHAGTLYSGLIYMPDPDTKPEHHQTPNILELIMPKIEGLNYGDEVKISTQPQQIIIR